MCMCKKDIEVGMGVLQSPTQLPVILYLAVFSHMGFSYPRCIYKMHAGNFGIIFMHVHII